MIAIGGILTILAISVFYWLKKRDGKVRVAPQLAHAFGNGAIATDSVVKSTSGIKEDDDGRRYREILKERNNKRCTYLRGKLQGKYWGEEDKIFGVDFQHAQFYDFCVYEVSVSAVSFAEQPFAAINDARFPREKLPETLPVQLEKDAHVYAVNVHEPIFSEVILNRKLHQHEGDFVFGTIEAVLSGYLVDLVPESYIEREYVSDTPKAPEPVAVSTIQQGAGLPTGKIQRSGIYKRLEYYGPNHHTRYWGKWTPEQNRAVQYSGPLTSVFDILAAVFGIAFLLFLIPQILLLLPFIFVPIILSFFSRSLSWGIGFISVLLVFLFLWALYDHGSRPESRPSTNQPPPSADRVATTGRADGENEDAIVNRPSVRRQTRTYIPHREDSLIRNQLSWKGYAGEAYSGEYSISMSQYLLSHEFKQAQAPLITQMDYTKLVYHVKTHDEPYLMGLYTMFDSIGNANQLNTMQFAEMIVSFVQHIPYALILPTACDANLYQDEFINRYLGNNARCVGPERFGLNTPVEFMTTLDGDCDTRSLFIYTVLSHYNYDVAMLTSVHHKHALIGVNLPYPGINYKEDSRQYVLWETTATGFKPGLLPPELSDTRHWNITLQSK